MNHLSNETKKRATKLKYYIYTHLHEIKYSLIFHMPKRKRQFSFGRKPCKSLDEFTSIRCIGTLIIRNKWNSFTLTRKKSYQASVDKQWLKKILMNFCKGKWGDRKMIKIHKDNQFRINTITKNRVCLSTEILWYSVRMKLVGQEILFQLIKNFLLKILLRIYRFIPAKPISANKRIKIYARKIHHNSVPFFL